VENGKEEADEAKDYHLQMLSNNHFAVLCWKHDTDSTAYGHSSGQAPDEAPVMIAEKRKQFFSFTILTP